MECAAHRHVFRAKPVRKANVDQRWREASVPTCKKRVRGNSESPFVHAQPSRKNRAPRSAWTKSRLTGRLLTPVQPILVDFPFGHKLRNATTNLCRRCGSDTAPCKKKNVMARRQKSPRSTGDGGHLQGRLADTVVEHTAAYDLFRCCPDLDYQGCQALRWNEVLFTEV